MTEREEIVSGFDDGFLLFGSHREVEMSVGFIFGSVFDSKNSRTNIVFCTLEPFALYSSVVVFFESSVDIVVGKHASIVSDGIFFEEDMVV